MKKLLILITIFIGYANAEIIELDCRYKTTYPNVNNGKEYDMQHLFTVDTDRNRMYHFESEFILEIRPHYYIAYPVFLFDNNELLLARKGVYPKEKWDYKINRENLTYFGHYLHLRPSRLDNGKCKTIDRKNLI